MEQKVLQPMSLDYTSFRKTFVKKKRMQWARPSIWYDADVADTINRETEDDAIANVLDDSRRQFKHRTDVFTPADRMGETRIAADYQWQKTYELASVIRFLMWVLILSDSHTRKMLMLSGWHKVDSEKNAPNITILSRVKTIDPRLIGRVMAGMKKPCPGKHHNQATCERVTTSNHDLCWSCHQVWPTREAFPDWMLAVVRDDYREFRRQAIEAVYHQEYVEADEAA